MADYLIRETKNRRQDQPKNHRSFRTVSVKEEENQKFQQASAQVAKIQQEARENMEQAIEEEGLNPQHFNEIMIRVQQDPALLQEVQNRIAPN